MKQKIKDKILKDEEILRILYDKGMIDFEGDEDDLIMQIPINIIKTGQFVVNVFRVGFEKGKQKTLRDFLEKLEKIRKLDFVKVSKNRVLEFDKVGYNKEVDKIKQEMENERRIYKRRS